MNSTVEWPMVEIGRYIYAISTSGGAVLHLLDTSGSRLAQIRFSEGGALAARTAMACTTGHGTSPGCQWSSTCFAMRSPATWSTRSKLTSLDSSGASQPGRNPSAKASYCPKSE